MLKKLKITTYVFILCLFGLTLITVSPVKAEDVPDRARDFQSELQLCHTTIQESLVATEAIRQSLTVLEGENVTCVAESRTLTEQLTQANYEKGLLREQLPDAIAGIDNRYHAPLEDHLLEYLFALDGICATDGSGARPNNTNLVRQKVTRVCMDRTPLDARSGYPMYRCLGPRC